MLSVTTAPPTIPVAEAVLPEALAEAGEAYSWVKVNLSIVSTTQFTPALGEAPAAIPRV
jgi:hypothetical protein